MKKKPFNLEQALKGKQVVEDDRIGHWVYSIDNPSFAYNGYIHIFQFSQPISSVNYLLLVNDEGHSRLILEGEDRGVLQMVCEEKEYWVATAISEVDGRMYTSHPIKDGEEAAIKAIKDQIHADNNTIQTHKIIRYE